MNQKSEYNFKLYDSLGSTNSFVLSNPNSFFHKDIVIASEQTSGRGRFEKKWVSSNKMNLYMTIVLKPSNATTNSYPISTITHYTAVSLLKTLKTYSPFFSIKWPNDIIFDETKKISGILCESAIKGRLIEIIAVGVGVNLNMTIDEINSIDKPATSLNLITGSYIDKMDFANLFAEFFFNEYNQFIENGFMSIKNFYTTNCNSINRYITVKNNSTEISGTVLAIKDSGEILLEDKNGKTLTLTAGDIVYGKESLK